MSDKDHTHTLVASVDCALAEDGAHPIKLVTARDGRVIHISYGCQNTHRDIVDGAHRMDAEQGHTCHVDVETIRELLRGEHNRYSLPDIFAKPPFAGLGTFLYDAAQSRRNENRKGGDDRRRRPAAADKSLDARLRRRFTTRFRNAISIDREAEGYSDFQIRRVQADDGPVHGCLQLTFNGAVLAQRDTDRVWTLFRDDIKSISEGNFIKPGRDGKCYVCESTFTAPRSHTRSNRHHRAVLEMVRAGVNALRQKSDPQIRFQRSY